MKFSEVKITEIFVDPKTGEFHRKSADDQAVMIDRRTGAARGIVNTFLPDDEVEPDAA